MSNELINDPSFVAFAGQILGSSELADGLDAIQLATLAAIGQFRMYGAREQICDEHDTSNEVYIIQNGDVEVWIDPARIGEPGAARRIALLRAGQTCGELALLDGGLRSAQMRAGHVGVKLMAFDRTALMGLCEADTAIGFRIMRNLAGGLALRLRLQDMRLYGAEPPDDLV